jgi:hypothetical protein
MADNPFVKTDKFFVMLNGKVVAKLFALEWTADVKDIIDAAEAAFRPKSTARQFVLSCGAGLDTSFSSWIADTFNASPTAKSVVLVAADSFSKKQRRFYLDRAYVKGYGFPAFDGSSKDTGAMKVILASEFVETKDTEEVMPSATTPTPYPIAAFRLDIVGLERETINVAKINALSVGVEMRFADNGSQRNPTLLPTKLSYPDLVISVPTTNTYAFQKWFESTLDRGAEKAKNGTLTLLTSNRSIDLCNLEFRNLVPSSLSKSGLNTEIRMYCDEVRIRFV